MANTSRRSVLAGALMAAAAFAAPAQASGLDQALEIMKSKGPDTVACFDQEKNICFQNLTNGSEFMRNRMPSNHSVGNRVAIAIHGGDDNALKGVFAAVVGLAESGITARFIMLPDNNTNPDDFKIEIYAGGGAPHVIAENVANPTTTAILTQLRDDVISDGKVAYQRVLAEGPPETTPG